MDEDYSRRWEVRFRGGSPAHPAWCRTFWTPPQIEPSMGISHKKNPALCTLPGLPKRSRSGLFRPLWTKTEETQWNKIDTKPIPHKVASHIGTERYSTSLDLAPNTVRGNSLQQSTMAIQGTPRASAWRPPTHTPKQGGTGEGSMKKWQMIVHTRKKESVSQPVPSLLNVHH